VFCVNVPCTLNIPSKENIFGDGHNMMSKLVGWYIDYNIINIHICKWTCWLFIVRNHQCMIMNHLKFTKVNFAQCLIAYFMWSSDMIYLLTAIWLSSGGRSTVHIYTQTIHRTIRNKQYIEQHNNFGSVWAVPRLG